MQVYGSRFPFPSPGAPPSPGMEPKSPALKADSLPLATGAVTYYAFLVNTHNTHASVTDSESHSKETHFYT